MWRVALDSGSPAVEAGMTVKKVILIIIGIIIPITILLISPGSLNRAASELSQATFSLFG